MSSMPPRPRFRAPSASPPGNPTASYLLCKVDPACSEKAAKTGLMPLGMPALSAPEIKTVSDWIRSRAKDRVAAARG